VIQKCSFKWSAICNPAFASSLVFNPQDSMLSEQHIPSVKAESGVPGENRDVFELYRDLIALRKRDLRHP